MHCMFFSAIVGEFLHGLIELVDQVVFFVSIFCWKTSSKILYLQKS